MIEEEEEENLKIERTSNHYKLLVSLEDYCNITGQHVHDKNITLQCSGSQKVIAKIFGNYGDAKFKSLSI